jgi:hypothetical protein
MAKIAVTKLSKTYLNERTGRLVSALERIDLEVRDGEFLCIVGPSGCGKTTLLQILAGLETASSGSMTLNGHAIRGPGADRGMVFQGYALFPWRTVLENIAFGLEIKGRSRRERRDVSQRYARMVGLSGFENAYPNELSGGMKQRVGIAQTRQRAGGTIDDGHLARSIDARDHAAQGARHLARHPPHHRVRYARSAGSGVSRRPDRGHDGTAGPDQGNDGCEPAAPPRCYHTGIRAVDAPRLCGAERGGLDGYG